MSDRTVLFTANAGFFVTVSGVTFAVDAFPQTADRYFHLSTFLTNNLKFYHNKYSYLFLNDLLSIPILQDFPFLVNTAKQ